jgi:flagellar protein FliS
MQSSAQGSYLETEVRTATPQKLRLLLIEGAIRFAEAARYAWQKNDFEEGCEAMIRSQNVVTELMTSVNRDDNPELAKKVIGIYLYVFRTLLDAAMNHDEQKLDDALRVLQEERKTWQEVCEKLGNQQPPPQQATPQEGPASTTNGGPHVMPVVETPELPDQPAGGFSLEA